jgi:hypothetical protein
MVRKRKENHREGDAMDGSIRPDLNRRHATRKSICLLTAVFCFLAPVTVTHTKAATENELAADPASQAAANADHQIAIGAVSAGAEGISLSARLSERGIDPLKDIDWRIFDSYGGAVFKGRAALADAIVPPGDYIVEAVYGGMSYRETISVLRGKHVSISFILNVGGLRILPTIPGVGGLDLPSTTRIFALAGPNRGKLMRESTTPGEIIRLPAGRYRLQSTFFSSNASSVSDVLVKPGIMSAVHIAHKAGTVELSLAKSLSRTVSWSIRSDKNEKITDVAEASARIVLAPGQYTATATSGTKSIETSFTINPGDALNLALDWTAD